MTDQWKFAVASALLATIVFLSPICALAAAKSETMSAPIPFKGDPPGGAELASKVVASFIVVSLIGVVGIFVLKRYLPTGFQLDRRQNRRLTLVETMRVTPKTTLILLDVDGASVLLAQSAETVTPIFGAQPATTTDPTDAA